MIRKIPVISKTSGERGTALNKPVWKSRLGWELLAGVLISLAVAVGAFFGCRWVAERAIETFILSETFQERQEEACITRLQSFVSSGEISLGDRESLDKWAGRERYVNLILTQNGRLVYDSTVPVEMESDAYGWDVAYYPWYNYHTIFFADGAAQAQVICFFELRYYNLAAVGSGLLAFLAFILLMAVLIGRKTAYIGLLARELKILEGGDLGYEVTECGGDELRELACGINDMRRAVIERRESEEAARRANHELVTAMSHDLRTPLTALIGYLEILEHGKYTDEKECRRFLSGSRQKALQIKELSDKLFEYFLVYGKTPESLELEQADAVELLQQTVGEGLFELESQGFTPQWELPKENCTLLVNVDQFRRVIDNLLSNIRKYADPSRPVKIRCRIQDGGLLLLLENAARKTAGRAQSTGLGLRTCEKIVRDHGGWFQSENADGIFSIRLYFPGR
ncbi:sensor histidine kinase [Anaerotruncus sp. AF02-27]|nr:sensor histidine kinase [Anaerotruncus sp. AF02-27]